MHVNIHKHLELLYYLHTCLCAGDVSACEKHYKNTPHSCVVQQLHVWLHQFQHGRASNLVLNYLGTSPLHRRGFRSSGGWMWLLRAARMGSTAHLQLSCALWYIDMHITAFLQ